MTLRYNPDDFDKLIAGNPDLVIVSDDGDDFQPPAKIQELDTDLIFRVVRVPDRTCYSTPRLVYTYQPPVNSSGIGNAVRSALDYIGPLGWLLLACILFVCWSSPIFAFALWFILLPIVGGRK